MNLKNGDLSKTVNTQNKTMARNKPENKHRPMKSKHNGLKHAERIKQNLEIIKKLWQELKKHLPL
jgi:hypothetical protein